MSLLYPRESFFEAHPKHDSPTYRSTAKRHPKQPLIILPHTMTEMSGPVYGHEVLREFDNDLTRQHAGEPQGERIIVQGRVLDEDGRPVPNTLMEVWQANAAGRYVHVVDDHPAPLDPNFSGAGRVVTDENGRYRFTSIKPGPYPWRNHHNAWRPAHIHLSLFGPSFLSRIVTQMYFEGDPLFPYDPILNEVPEHARHRLISKFDLDVTESEWALGYTFDIVVRGKNETPMETK